MVALLKVRFELVQNGPKTIGLGYGLTYLLNRLVRLRVTIYANMNRYTTVYKQAGLIYELFIFFFFNFF